MRRAPGDNVLPDQFQTLAAVLASDWCQNWCPHYLPLGLRGCQRSEQSKQWRNGWRRERGGGGGGGTSVHRLCNGLLKNSDLKVYTALFVYNLVIGYSKRREKIIRLKAFDKKKKIPGLKSNQVLGTVLQCSYFSVISRFPLKTVQRYQNFLAVLPPHSIQS